MKTCPKCNSTHNKPGIFCSRTCANSRGKRTEEFKEKVRSKLRKNFFNCIVCGCVTNKRRKTCSVECLTNFNKTKIPPKTPGGLRQGAGRGKHGWYKGFYLDSNYELAYLIYCLDHSIDITRNKKSYTYTDPFGKTKKFYPDFIVNGKITEIKGYYANDLDAKINAVDEPIDVLFSKDLTDVFQYVENKTNLKIFDLYKLYD